MFDAEFRAAVAPLAAAGMGTENAAGLLYSLLRMTRPRRVLEVGMGYTTPLLLRALADNVAEFDADRARLAAATPGDERLAILSPRHYARPHQPALVAIDDLSLAGSTAPLVLDIVRRLGLDRWLRLIEGDFRGASARLDSGDTPFDFIWFDCGGPAEYVDFLDEYWPLLSRNHGLLALHYTYWTVPAQARRPDGSTIQGMRTVAGSILNELKRRQAKAGADAGFEVLSLLEPHKHRQGSVTLIRRLADASTLRDADFRAEIAGFTGQPFDRDFKLD